MTAGRMRSWKPGAPEWLREWGRERDVRSHEDGEHLPQPGGVSESFRGSLEGR